MNHEEIDIAQAKDILTQLQMSSPMRTQLHEEIMLVLKRHKALLVDLKATEDPQRRRVIREEVAELQKKRTMLLRQKRNIGPTVDEIAAVFKLKIQPLPPK